MKTWLTGQEAAALAAVTPTAIHNARRAGRLTATRRPDRVWRYETAEVESYANDVAWRRRRAAERRDWCFERESERRSMDAAPLLALIATRGGPAACGIRSAPDLEILRLARSFGRVTPLGGRRLARRCGVRVSDLWLSEPVLDAEPLLRQVALRGGPSSSGLDSTAERALLRAHETGRLTLAAADQLAVRLGLTVWELWPEPHAA